MVEQIRPLPMMAPIISAQEIKSIVSDKPSKKTTVSPMATRTIAIKATSDIEETQAEAIAIPTKVENMIGQQAVLHLSLLSVAVYIRRMNVPINVHSTIELLDRYDEVVVRNEAVLPGGISKRLADVSDRIEIIVNQNCAVNCPDAVAHIASIERDIQTFAEGGTPVPRPCTQLERRRTDSVYIEPDRRLLLAGRGFAKFKIEGRNASPIQLLRILTSNILTQGCGVLDLDVMRPIMKESLVLEVARVRSENHKRVPLQELTRIPESLFP